MLYLLILFFEKHKKTEKKQETSYKENYNSNLPVFINYRSKDTVRYSDYYDGTRGFSRAI